MSSKMKKWILVWVLAVVCAPVLYAGEYHTHARIFTPYQGTPVTIGQPEATIDVPPSTTTLPHVDASIYDLVTLGVDQNYPQFFGSAMDVKVKVKINRWDASLMPLADTSVYVEINYHPFDTLSYIDKSAVRFFGAYKMTLTIDSIYVNGSSVNDLPANLFLDGDIYLDRYLEFTSAGSPIAINIPDPNDPDELLDTDCDGNLDEIVITWPITDGVEEYQLEWTFVNDYGTTTGSYLPASSLQYDFRNNSTRITTVNNYYRITLAFDHGYVLFRVRGIGRDINNLSQIITGVWSAADNGSVSSLPIQYHVTAPYEGDKNWQFSTTFAEEGKKKEVASYFDGSLRNRQTVTKINSDNNTVVGETIYDHQGRPAVTVLPVPVVDPNCTDPNVESSLKFYPNFNQNISGSGYSKNDFDKSSSGDTCNLNAGGMGTTSGASNYYSPANPNKEGIQAYVPDAQLFPFTQVEYTPDNTGRIRRQGGVGPEFQLGSDHETKYFYGQPNQIQLDRLFGSEVGDAAHYKKNLVIDPNGQVSVSYLDQEGRVVATALAGDAPQNLTALESEANAAVELTIDLFNEDANGGSNSNKLNPNGDALVYSTQLLVGYPSTYFFDYSLNVDTLFDPCLNGSVCFNCVYDLEIQIKDECGAPLYNSDVVIGKFTNGVNGIEFNTACDNPTDFSYNENFSVALSPGNYTVSKILHVNADAREYYINAYLDPANNSCIKTLEDFQNEFLSQVDTMDCFISCDECVASLGSRDDFVSQGKGTAAQYDVLLEACNKPCKDITLCETAYEMMLSDVSPGGQYAEFLDNSGNYNPGAFSLSVLNTSNLLPKSYSVGNANWRFPKAILNGNTYTEYLKDDGTRDRVTVSIVSGNFSPAVVNTALVFTDATTGQLYTWPENLASVVDFINLFQPSWAQSLVTYHPEYCYYETCSGYAGEVNTGDEFTSESFDALLLKTNTFADAVAAKFIKNNYASINNINNRLNDWFTVTPNKPWDAFVVYSSSYDNYGVQLQNLFNNYYNDGVNTYSMPQFAAMMVRCGNNLGVVPGASCYRFGDDFIPGNPTLNDQIRDQEWVMLKGLYRSAKQQLQKERADERALTSCSGFNDCIGNDDFNPFSAGMITNTSPGNWFNNPYYNVGQPCGAYTWQMYVNKQKRFPDESEIPVQSAQDAAYQQYLQTGQCPNTFAFQNLLSAVAAHDELDGTGVNISTYPELSALFLAQNNFTLQNPVPQINWNSTATATEIQVQLYDATNNTAYCNVSVDITGTSIAAWDDIIGFTNLQSTGTTSPYTFTALAILQSGSSLVYEPVTGKTCIDISSCRFQTACSGNELSNDLAMLMSALASNGQLTSTNVNLETGYALALTTPIRNAVGTPNTNLRWTYNSTSHVFSLFDNTNPTVTVELAIYTVDPSTFNLSNLSSIKAFGNMASEWENAFVVDGYDASGNFLVTIHGDAQHVSGSTATGISMGECSLPEPLACEGEGFDAADDLEKLIKDFLVTQNFSSNIDLYSSLFWTPLLESYLTPDTTITSTSSTYTQTVNGGIHYDTLNFALNGCNLTLTHSDNNTPPRTLNDVIAIDAFTATGLADNEGNMHEFYFLAQYNIGGIIYTDTIFGSTCFPLRNCKGCPDSTNFDQPDSAAIAQQDLQLLQQGITYTDKSVLAFADYQLAIDNLNTRMGWTPSDSAYVNAYDFADYFLEGVTFPTPSYIRFINNYDPDLDNYQMLIEPDTFVATYGYGTNVKMEYDRYALAVNLYNQRAAQQSLPSLSIMADTTFTNELVADSISAYIKYVELQPIGGQPADDAVTYLTNTGKLIVLQDSCEALYNLYASAYKQFAAQQQINNTCLDYQIYSPLYSLADFKNNNLCCSNAGYAAILDYIDLFYDTTQCPGALPLLESCSTPTTDTSACQKLYTLYRRSIRQFNQSAWAQANNQHLVITYKNFDKFLRAGYCDCITAWLKYISVYINASPSTVLPPAQNIDQFADCQQTQPIEADPCEQAYDQYLNCIAVYNQWAIANHGTVIRDIVKFETFVSDELCFCVDAYCTSLNSIMTGLVTNPEQIKVRLSIIRVCDVTTKVPCTPELPLTITQISPPAPYSNPCAEFMINNALENAENAYNQYIDSVTNYIATAYNNHCLSAVESFNATYTDKEYHFTLYYYDQAGNLIKTVPPEGVEALALDNSNPNASALKNQIIADRTNNTHTVFTQHRMATIYEYNSLNQLVKQSMPDHDKMDIFEITLPNGLNAALEATSIQMVNSNVGYMSGKVTSGGITRGYLYQTNDGGVTWTRLNDIVSADLKKVQMVDATTGYAVGTHGIVLKTTDAGNNWDMLNTYQYNITEQLNDLHFINANEGVIVGERSRVLKTTDGGATFTTYLLPYPASNTNRQHIKAITHDGTDYFIAVNRQFTNNSPVIGNMFLSPNGNSGTWTQELQVSSADLLEVNYYQNNRAYAAGVDGSLLQTTNNGASWRVISTGLDKSFKQVLFKDDDEGIALIETSTGFNQLFKTADAGSTWTLMSNATDNYTRLYAYQDNGYGAKVAAVGKNGLVQRVIMEDNTPFGIIDLNSPNTGTDFTAVWSQTIGSNVWIVIAASNGSLYSTTDANASTVTWSVHSAPTLATNNAKVIEADRTTGGGNPAISGTILTNNGSLLALFKAQNASNYTVTAFSSPTGVSVSDIALDEPNDRVLAFDNTAKQAYRVDLNSTSASTTATLIPQANTITQANGLAYQNSRVIVTGNNGEIFTGILDGTASNVTWTDNTQNTNPLPLQDIQYSGASGTVYAAGTDGKVLQRQSSGNWKTMTTGITKNINRIYFASATSGLIAGDQGLLSLFAVSGTAINNGMLPVNNGPINENLHDVISSGTIVYVAGENGTVLYTPDVINTPFAITNQNTSNDFYGLALKPSSTQAYAIGENSKIHWCIGASRTVVKNVFTPTLKDVHFADLNNGTLAGDNFTLRQTHDGGVTWEVILPNNTTVNKVINRVWTINGNYALAVGDGKYLSAIENNIATEQPNSLFPGAGNNFLAIAFNPDQPFQGYIAGNQRRLRGITLTPSGSSFTISMNNGIAQPVFTAPVIPNATEIRALQVFDNNSVMAVGNNNFIGYYNTSAWVDVRNNSLPATTVYNDVYFHDHYNGYAVGNNGVMLRSTNTSLNSTTGYLTGTTWQQKSIVDGFNITANSQANITAIVFASRYNGVWGGSYNITNTTNKPYIRLIRDESELFSTYFWYDKLGRIVVSQNTKQRNGASSAGVQRFSYTLFDELGRVIEAGEKTENTTASTKFNSIFGTTVANYFNPKVIDDAKLNNWIADNTGARKEVTKSYYDETVITGLPVDFTPNPINQRKRIVHVTYEDIYDGNDQTYDHGTHYETDVHGSIKTVIQDNKKIESISTISNQRFKRIDYSYDFISGNVNKVEYQNGQADEWNHRYEYDADNRLTQVETSNNDFLWDKDAKYSYYAHGPIARTEIGDNQVQGVDYVYTIQGWIKGVNSSVLSENNDPGKDGNGVILNNQNRNFARDIFGYSLGYFSGDFQSIDPTNHGNNSFTASISGSDLEANRKDLYNGNIGSMITTITNPVTREVLPLGNAYKYDQLNRLLQAVSYNDLDLSTSNSTFNSFGTGGSQMYYNSFAYDANGNIETQLRKDDQNNSVDNLTYRYAKDANGKTIQNRLYHVNEDPSISDNAYTNDIDDQGLFDPTLSTINSNNNYGFDEIGNLVSDKKEEIQEIIWDVKGKIKEIKRVPSSTKFNLKFDYDANGRRVAKHMYDQSNVHIKSEYYVLDATGAIISVYSHLIDDNSQVEKFVLNELDIYGIEKVGITTPDLELINVIFENIDLIRELGKKNYFFANHLGNIVSTTSDIKIPVENSTSSGVVDHYVSDIKTSVDYSAFGVQLNNRDFSVAELAYGINGQRKDNEVYGEGRSYTAEFWQYDPLLGRRWNIDVVKKEWESPYAAFANNPIQNIDPNGADTTSSHATAKNFSKLEGNKNLLIYFRDDSDGDLVKEDEMMKNSVGYDFVVAGSYEEAMQILVEKYGADAKNIYENLVIRTHGTVSGKLALNGVYFNPADNSSTQSKETNKIFSYFRDLVTEDGTIVTTGCSVASDVTGGGMELAKFFIGNTNRVYYGNSVQSISWKSYDIQKVLGDNDYAETKAFDFGDQINIKSSDKGFIKYYKPWFSKSIMYDRTYYNVRTSMFFGIIATAKDTKFEEKVSSGAGCGGGSCTNGSSGGSGKPPK